MTAQLSREELKQSLIECNQNSAGMFEVGEDTMCAMMALLEEDSEPYWWAIENRHGDARFIEGEHAKNDIWDEVHELNAKDDAGEYFDSDAPYTVVPVFRHAAPVAVPDDVLSAMEEVLRISDRDHEAWHRARAGISACRAAMQSFGNSEQLEPVSQRYTLPPHIYRELVNQLRDTAVKYQGCQQLREQISETLSTVITPAVNSSNPEISGSYTLPDGWKLVPVEPTEKMVIEGFESEPDEFFSDEDEWKKYQDMSGCEQAAHRAKLCWSAMLAAAPTAPEQEV